MNSKRRNFLIGILSVACFLSGQALAAYPQKFASENYSLGSRSIVCESELPEIKKTRTVYFISGLAADERLFHNLQLPENIKVKYLPWLEPEKAESMNSYCRRLASRIDTSSGFVLVGLSFGGMAAIEMNKFLRPRKTVLISSIVTDDGLSRFFRIVHRLRLH